MTNNRLYISSLLTLLLLVAGTFSVSAQIVDAEGQYVDTVFHDNVDRTAEDFVTVSLMISQPSDKFLYSIFGHAALRLQCPIFGLDYVYSYISSYYDASVLTYLYMTPKMGLVTIPTETYIQDDFRGIREYQIFLPPSVEIDLWQILDEDVAKGYYLPYDCVSHSCAQMTYQYINRAFALNYAKDSIKTEWIFEPKHTMHELMNIYAKEAPWQLLVINSLLGNSYVDDVHMSNAKKILFPEQLLALWHATKFSGKPLLSEKAEVHTVSKVMEKPKVTPLWCSLLLLVLSIVSLLIGFVKKIEKLEKCGIAIDYFLLGLQTIAGGFMILMMLVAYLPFPEANWNWLLIPFNILPIILWKWRSYWTLPYAGILVVWVLYMVFAPHMIVSVPHIIFVLAFVVVLLKQSNIYSLLVEKCIL